MFNDKITQEKLKELLRYDEDTGLFYWQDSQKARGRKRFSGKIAGAKDWKGYIDIKIDDISYKAHRLAWLYVYGYHPTFEIDHINHDKSDNRIQNLREATRDQQQQYKGCYKNNKIGIKGVSIKNGLYVVRIQHSGVRKHIGSYNCPTAAHFAYVKAAKNVNKLFAKW